MVVESEREVPRWADVGFECCLNAEALSHQKNPMVSSSPELILPVLKLLIWTGRLTLTADMSTVSLAWGVCLAASRISNSVAGACLLQFINSKLMIYLYIFI